MFQILPQNLQLGSLGKGSGHVHFRPSTPVILMPSIDNDLPRRGMELITEQSPAVIQSHNPELCTGRCLKTLWKRMWTHRTHPCSHEASIPMRKTRNKHNSVSGTNDVMRKNKPLKGHGGAVSDMVVREGCGR